MIPLIEERYASIEKQVGVETLQQAYDVLDALLRPLGSAPADVAEAEADPTPRSRRRRSSAGKTSAR
jgi:hypothetical protein